MEHSSSVTQALFFYHNGIGTLKSDNTTVTFYTIGNGKYYCFTKTKEDVIMKMYFALMSKRTKIKCCGVVLFVQVNVVFASIWLHYFCFLHKFTIHVECNGGIYPIREGKYSRY